MQSHHDRQGCREFRRQLRLSRREFLSLVFQLQKDGLTMNVIAFDVKAVRVRETARLEEVHSTLPGALEWWAEPERGVRTPFRYLTALRQSPRG